MASLQAIAKAQASGLALKQMFGVQPDYEYLPDHVKVYYTPDKLLQVQNKIASMSTAAPGEIRIDWVPMVAPLAIKKSLPFAIGALVAGYIVGKIL